jgi:hypothetical protein
MENSKPNIIQYCHIRNGAVFFNGQLDYEATSGDFETFAENTYKHFEIRYPKFYKMDNLSKLGFLCAELTLKNSNLSKYKPENIAINVVNKNSSIDTDIRYNNLIAKGASSPAIFVYSLPNIMTGEICIRHNIKGDNLLFLSDKYDTGLQCNYVDSLFDMNVCEAVVCGWIDYVEGCYEAFLMFIEKNNPTGILPFTNRNIQQLYKNV